MSENEYGLCPVCGGNRSPGTTLFAADFGEGIVVVRDVPASICDKCGGSLFDNETAGNLERIVEDAKRNKRQIEVISAYA